MNSIQASRLHQAYLFTGSRGIGKTSIARIFSKVIRCENTRKAPKDGIEWLLSCDQCPSCREITSSTSVDVLEIDGASNNGVDAVREIRENARFLPASGSRKIYIIDEVHMLTTAAFNALLKTLEEPPAHVIFIFATTEPHKIPATILSRCQRFDYRRVTLAQIQGRLLEICGAESIQAEPAALALIARAAEGSMRDALSLLDQVIAFAGGELTAASVRESVGLVEGQLLLGIVSGILARKPLDALSLVDQAYERGHDLRVLTRSLIELLHSAILAKVGVTESAHLDLSAEEWKDLAAATELRPLDEIEMIFQVLHHGMDWIARSPQPKIVLDVLVVKCATAEALFFAESRAQAGPPPSQGPATGGSLPMGGGGTSARVSSAPATPLPGAGGGAGAAAAQGAAPSWEGFIDHVRIRRPLLATLLEHGNCLHLPGDSALELKIAFCPKDSYFREQLQSRVYHEQLLALSREYFGMAVRVQLEIREGGESLAEKRSRELQRREQAAREAARAHPTILEAKALFGGDLGPIELSEALSGGREGGSP